MAKKAPAEPKPLATYGLPQIQHPQWGALGQDQKQLLYEMQAFRRKWSIDKGGLPRYEHFRNGVKLMWPWIKWNPWMEKQCKAFCENNWVGIAGCAGCVSGDTRILNPITGEQPTIEYLTQNRIAPIVMTLNGPERAEVPFVKGHEELFEVCLSNGTKFTATAKHLVLSESGFVPVGSLSTSQRLFGYEHVLPGSISDGDPLTHASSVPSSLKTTEGFQADCHPSLRCGGELLPLALAAARPSAPSHTDAPTHTRSDLHSDDPASIILRSRFCESSFHPSSLGFSIHRSWFGILEKLHAFQGRGEYTARSSQHGEQSPWQTPFLVQVLEQDRGSARTQSECEARECCGEQRTRQPIFHYNQLHERSQPSSCCDQSVPKPYPVFGKSDFFGTYHFGAFLPESSLMLRVTQNTIVSIRAAGKATFYDITVPNAAHYFAEGSIHHNSSKTTTSVIYGVFWWLCGIQDSAMVLTSTTKSNIRSRAWSWTQRLFSSIPGPRIGNMVDSRTTWQATKGDDRHCVCALAVREGSTQKAVGRLQGFHPDGRMLVIIDEATDTPEAIFESFPNLIAGNWDFQVIALANPASRFDPFGKFVTPANGWNSVTVEDDEWETETKLDGKTGICIHFDAERSPNVIAGQQLYEYLPTQRMLDAARAKLGATSPWFYKFWRGFLPPEGVVQTVLTESLLAQHDAAGSHSKHIFVGGRVFMIAFLDPAFGGGDRAVLRIAKCSELESGSIGIQLTKSIQLNISAVMKDEFGKLVPVHYQISRQAIWHCKDNGVESGNFGLDSTGEGGGLADIISREWSGDIHRVEFGGKPSDTRVSHEDDRLCCDVYDRKVTELHFTVKEFVVAGQLKGINSREASDLCNRLWRMKGRKLEIEPKTKRKGTGDAEETSNFGFKERMGRSPDDGDALCGVCEVAKRVGVSIKTQGRTARAGNDWLKIAQKHDEIYAEPVDDWNNRASVDVYAMEDV